MQVQNKHGEFQPLHDWSKQSDISGLLPHAFSIKFIKFANASTQWRMLLCFFNQCCYSVADVAIEQTSYMCMYVQNRLYET